MELISRRILIVPSPSASSGIAGKLLQSWFSSTCSGLSPFQCRIRWLRRFPCGCGDRRGHLVGDALESAVSAFDGFGRAICARKSANIRFQGIPAARQKVQVTFGFDFADGLRADEWECACRVFQKRHLLAHKMGVIDEEYLQRANDTGAVLGRKVRLTEGEVESAINIVETMGRRLFSGVLPAAP